MSSQAAFRYFRESEATWHIVKPENGVIGPRAAGPMVRAMTEKAKELGAEIYLETPGNRPDHGRRANALV